MSIVNNNEILSSLQFSLNITTISILVETTFHQFILVEMVLRLDAPNDKNGVIAFDMFVVSSKHHFVWRV